MRVKTRTQFKHYGPHSWEPAKAVDIVRALANSWIRPCHRDNWIDRQKILYPSKMKRLAKVREFLEKLEGRQFDLAGNG